MKHQHVTILSSSNVVAAHQDFPVEAPPLVLSPLDNLMGYSAYQKRALYFKGGVQDDLVSVLRDSLSKTLVHFYPFAGRVSLTDSNAVLLLHCNNAGVTFLEAETDSTLEDLGEFLPSEFSDELCQMEVFPEWPWRVEYPLFTVQVTKFACGGLSVGVSFSHAICDGPSFWYFMNSWAQVSRTGGLQLLPDTSFKIPLKEFSLEERQKHLDLLDFGLVERKHLVQMVRRSGWKRLSEVAVQKMKFTRHDIIDLKSKAPGLTGFEVLVAYLWKRLAMSWGKPGDEATSLFILVNCRQKVRNLSKTYVGNAILPTASVTTVDELEHTSLEHTAKAIHEAIGVCTEETMAAIVNYAYEKMGDQTHMPFMKMKTGTNVLIVSSPRHPVYETDFGWGRPIDNSFGANDLGHCKVYLFPSPAGNGAIDVTVALNPECMDKFVVTSDFLV